MLIAGDIGGTKTLLAIYDPKLGPNQPLASRQYPSKDYNSLADIVRQFLREHPYKPTQACFDLAGPVFDGQAKLTNLSWHESEQQLAIDLKLDHVTLMNDLKAIAYAIPLLEQQDLSCVNPGIANPRGAIAVVAPGTGLGEAFLVHDGRSYLACHSEGGHASFAPATPLQTELMQYMLRFHHHVSFERVCSGLGISNIYKFLRDSGNAIEDAAFAAQLHGLEDWTPLIVATAVNYPGKNPLCDATLKLFVEILGSACGNMALKVLATGGVYLAGGMPPRILNLLQGPDFMKGYTNKGRFSSMMKTVPVYVVLNRAALLGAAAYGLDFMTARSVI